MFGIGMPELLIILVIILIIFGAGKLPEIGSALGRGIKNFKKATREPNEIDVTPSCREEDRREEALNTRQDIDPLTCTSYVAATDGRGTAADGRSAAPVRRGRHPPAEVRCRRDAAAGAPPAMHRLPSGPSYRASACWKR